MRRVVGTFTVLVGFAAVALAVLMSALGRPAGPSVGMTVFVSGVGLVATLGLGLRMLLVVDRARRMPLRRGEHQHARRHSVDQQ